MQREIWRSLSSTSFVRAATLSAIALWTLNMIFVQRGHEIVGVIVAFLLVLAWSLHNTARLQFADEASLPHSLWTRMFRSKAFPFWLGAYFLVSWAITTLAKRTDWLASLVVLLPTMILVVAQLSVADRVTREARAKLNSD